jgi:hypothetical protein
MLRIGTSHSFYFYFYIFSNPTALILKVCARYGGYGGWQQCPEIIRLLLNQWCITRSCGHWICGDQTYIAGCPWFSNGSKFHLWLFQSSVPKGTCPYLSMCGCCAVLSVASYVVNTIVNLWNKASVNSSLLVGRIRTSVTMWRAICVHAFLVITEYVLHRIHPGYRKLLKYILCIYKPFWNKERIWTNKVF